jgi:glycosyltransferase involved in cell wall biosynthesis
MKSVHDLSARTFRKKQRLLASSKVHFVAVSNWLADRARQSAVIGDCPVTVIPNALSLSQFQHIDKTDARSMLGIKERYVLCFGAARIDDDIKGFSYLVEALRIMVSRHTVNSADIRLLLFGGIRDEHVLNGLPVSHTYLGYINDHHRLSQVYSASDAVVSSSLYETFGQTLVEAQACGCTPVAFAGSGQADIISHRENGFLAEYLSADSLADGISWAFSTPIPYEVLRKNVCRKYAGDAVAQRYIRLYNSLP